MYRYITALKFQIVMALVLLLAALCFAGCVEQQIPDEQSGVSLSVVQNDVEAIEQYAKMLVETNTFNVIKRQTNIEDKEDIIYVTIKGANEYCEVEQHYKLLYVLYNEGWMLEEITAYTDDSHQYTTTPTKEYFTEELIKQFIGQTDLTEYASPIKYSQSSSGNFCEYSYSNIEKVQSSLYENFGVVTYRCQVTYEYPCLTETIVLPIICEFSTENAQWTVRYDQSSITRDLSLNQGILGTWEFCETNTYAMVTVTEHDNNSCYVALRDEQSGKGFSTTAQLHLSIYYNDSNEIKSAALKFQTAAYGNDLPEIWLATDEPGENSKNDSYFLRYTTSFRWLVPLQRV